MYSPWVGHSSLIAPVASCSKAGENTRGNRRRKKESTVGSFWTTRLEEDGNAAIDESDDLEELRVERVTGECST